MLLEQAGADAVARAARIIANVASMQETREDDAHYGNFRWFQEDAGVTDLNGVEFVLDHLNVLVRDFADVLSPAALRQASEMIALGLEEIDRLDVHPSYTNIFLSDISNSVLGGEALGEPAYVERGARRLGEWFEFTARSGAPHEFNSPTYLAVDIARMAALAERTSDPAIALRARVAEERLWLHAATHYHPLLAQLAGPHSRAYYDGWSGAGGYLKLMLWLQLGDAALRRDTPYARSREEGHLGVARDLCHVPPYVRAILEAKRFPFATRETADAAAGLDIATYMTESYALGTASRSYAVGEPPEPWPQFNSTLLYFRRDGPPGYGSLFARYIINDKDAGAVVHESTRTAEDLWEEGRHVGAQHRNRAIVAYGLQPRTRPVYSARLSLRVLGVGPEREIWCADHRVRELPHHVEPGEPVTLDAGGAYVAVIPLEPTDMGSGAPIVLDRAGGALVLDIYNYRGPAKTFWEHRSQSGPFYKGNVRNAFVLEAAGRDEYAGFAAFRAHIAGARIADSMDEDYRREIVYASDGGSVALRYSLWDMSLLERRFDGVAYAPPMGRAGAVDGGGWQWLQARDSLVELAGVKLLAGRAPKWLAVDPGAGRCVFVNPSDEAVPLWLETPRTVIECDEIGFARVELDEAAGCVTVEAAEEIGPLRLRAAGELRLLINGQDVSDALTPPGPDGVREFRGLA